MGTILFIWSMVAMSQDHVYGRQTGYAWTYSGEYATVQHCENAGRQLGIKPEFFRCVPTGKK